MASNAAIQHDASSSSHATHTYDVFVSFHGEDTRNTFTDFLFHSLRTKGINVFKEDKDLKRGESIAPKLLQAIQVSRLFIVVFSQNYASSTWCLRELAEICNCCETSPSVIIPIFYDVDPSVVRKQSGCYEKAFAEHEKRFGEDEVKMEEVQRWRQALTQVANISGWDIRNKSHCEQIEEIVQEIMNILGYKMSRQEELVRIVVTLAGIFSKRINHQYNFPYFIDDASKILKGDNFQEKILVRYLVDRITSLIRN